MSDLQSRRMFTQRGTWDALMAVEVSLPDWVIWAGVMVALIAESGVIIGIAVWWLNRGRRPPPR